ncbi:hypothetical protein K502DRAFT_323392 [Neoconidiobolus thromboides FSU 785]|nr:hypothetical protein K502DRAFT_323392 [Neoconidiobolus thromboides FSU 785]
MAVPPQSHRRWKCPAHADHVAPKIKKFKCQVKGINGTKGDTSNELEVDEERITMEFVTKVAENKKLARFNEIKNIMQQDIIAKLIEPRTNVQNQLNVINSLGNITKNKETKEEPKGTVDSDSTVNNDLREKFKKLINEITSTQKEDNNEEIESIIPGVSKEALTKPYIKIARPVYRQLNAVRQLVEVVDKKKLLDFLVENANINTNNS